MNLYADILNATRDGRKLLAILLDPDKIHWEAIEFVCDKINASPATHILIGGSHVASQRLDELVATVKTHCRLPIVLFPGNPSQISPLAHGILFLSLVSGRNPDFLIGHQVAAAPVLRHSGLEIIPTGYLLIESGGVTAVEFVSGTSPLPLADHTLVVNTVLASEMLGHKLIYLEAGSGAPNPVPPALIQKVRRAITVPLIVGGGITDLNGIEAAYEAGADMVVIGTAFENNPGFFN